MHVLRIGNTQPGSFSTEMFDIIMWVPGKMHNKYYFSIFAAMLQNRLHTFVAHFTIARSAIRQNKSNFSFQSILPEAYQCYFLRQGASQ